MARVPWEVSFLGSSLKCLFVQTFKILGGSGARKRCGSRHVPLRRFGCSGRSRKGVFWVSERESLRQTRFTGSNSASAIAKFANIANNTVPA